MIVVIATYGEELESFHMDVLDIPTFVVLVKNYGYRDSEGDDYIFESAHVEARQRVYVNVEEK